MSETHIEIDCDLCGSPEKQFVKTEFGFPISRCRKCSFVYVNQIPTAQDGKVIGEYYSGTNDEINASQNAYQKVSEFLMNEINSLKDKKGNLLDVGCGYGFFLLEAKKNGWQVFGTELSHIAVSYANEKQNLPNVRFSDLSDAEFSTKKFDVINLTNVLEHVPSPTKTLNDCVKKLEDNAILMIRVPNMDFHDLKAKFVSLINAFGLSKGGEVCYLASPPPLHLTGFNSRTLNKYFKKVGLQPVRIKPSKLSSLADEKLIFRIFERFIDFLYKLSFSKINLSPTLLAIAVKKEN